MKGIGHADFYPVSRPAGRLGCINELQERDKGFGSRESTLSGRLAVSCCRDARSVFRFRGGVGVGHVRLLKNLCACRLDSKGVCDRQVLEKFDEGVQKHACDSLFIVRRQRRNEPNVQGRLARGSNRCSETDEIVSGRDKNAQTLAGSCRNMQLTREIDESQLSTVA
jgi:hypothetical protein